MFDFEYKPLKLDLNPKEHTQLYARFSKEISSLFIQCNNVKLEKINKNCIITLNYNNNNYIFELHHTFPFNKPIKILVNNINYNRILCDDNDNDKIIPYIKKYSGSECLCCKSITCEPNWSPATRITSIINEIELNLIIKYKIQINILCDKIREKYNCSSQYGNFLNIEDYLF